MVLKIIDATQAKSGKIILVDNEPYNVKSNDISKTGKHGSAKCRIALEGVFSKRKKILAVPGGEKFDIPNVEKRRVQILSMNNGEVSVMDLESYETTDVAYQEDLKESLLPEKQAELWDIEGTKKIMRVL